MILVRFFRSNFYWILLTSAMLGLATVLFPHRCHHGRRLEDLFARPAQFLRTPVHVHMENLPLDQALACLGAEARCELTPSWARLEKFGIAPNMRISACSPTLLTLDEALMLLIRSMRIVETTEEIPSAPDTPEARSIRARRQILEEFVAGLATTPSACVVYDVSDLVSHWDPEKRDQRVSLLVDQIAAGNECDSPYQVSTSNIWSFNSKLIVRTSPYRHRKIAEFLMQLRDD